MMFLGLQKISVVSGMPLSTAQSRRDTTIQRTIAETTAEVA